MKGLIYLFCAIMLVLSGCTGQPEDPRLLEISEKVSDFPDEMLVRLDSIDVGSLKENDRNFHALLRIKAQDKAFIQHTSDSAILKVIEYYSGHKGSGYYPEALYYGGRVYSDMGDAPTALRYFQNALDALPEGKDDNLRSIIFSQKGSLLNSLWLYKEAAACIKESIRLKVSDGDSLNLMRDTQLLGAVYMHAGYYDCADSCFRVARNIGCLIQHKDTSIQDMYLAGNELYRGRINDALKIIRKAVGNIPNRRRDMSHAYASQIYLEADIPDTAYYYALMLIECENNDYRKIGYNMLLHPKLKRYSKADSLLSYSLAYGAVLDEYLEGHDAFQVTMQTSLYNYQNHERKLKKAEMVRKIYMYAAGVALILIMVLLITMLYLRNARIKTLLDYRKALDDIDQLKKSLYLADEELRKYDNASIKEDSNKTLFIEQPDHEIFQKLNTEESLSEEEKEKNKLRERLKENLLALQAAGQAKKDVPSEIKGLSCYVRLQEYILTKKTILDSDELWLDLENAVLSVSPEFKFRLNLLTGERMKVDVYHMALLIKCGISPTEMQTLIGRSKGAISSRRGYICEKIFGQKLGAKVMDDIIRLL